MYGLMGKIVTHPGQRDALVAILTEVAAQMGNVDGCRAYQVAVDAEGAQDANDPNGVWVYEVWDSQQQHDASLQGEEVRAVIAAARPLIAGMSDRREFRVALRSGKE